MKLLGTLFMSGLVFGGIALIRQGIKDSDAEFWIGGIVLIVVGIGGVVNLLY